MDASTLAHVINMRGVPHHGSEQQPWRSALETLAIPMLHRQRRGLAPNVEKHVAQEVFGQGLVADEPPAKRSAA
jgi:hypothetical protein